MKAVSFDEILREKMEVLGRGASTSTQASSSASLDFDKWSGEPAFPAFEAPVTPRRPLKAPYATQRRAPSVSAQPAHNQAPQKPAEPQWIFKLELSDEAQSKWSLFEKTVGVDLGEKTTKSVASAAFRKFIKSVHPDLTKKTANHNFAVYVKIKDEFLKELTAPAAK